MYFILVVDVTNQFSFFVVIHQILYTSLRKLVQLGYIKTNCLVISCSILERPSLKRLTYWCAPVHISKAYLCPFTKLCFREPVVFH